MKSILINEQFHQDFILSALTSNGQNPYNLQVKGQEIYCDNSVILEMIKRCIEGETSILPVQMEKQGYVLWLVVIPNKDKLIKHVEEIKSFIVPTLAEPQFYNAREFDAGKPGLGCYGASLYPHGYYCFYSPLVLADQVLQALKIWSQLDSRRPEDFSEDIKINAFVLRRNFQQAIALQNWEEASNTLTVIRQGRYLSDENCQFLRMQLLSAQGKWTVIWQDKEFANIAGLHPGVCQDSCRQTSKTYLD